MFGIETRPSPSQRAYSQAHQQGPDCGSRLTQHNSGQKELWLWLKEPGGLVTTKPADHRKQCHRQNSSLFTGRTPHSAGLTEPPQHSQHNHTYSVTAVQNQHQCEHRRARKSVGTRPNETKPWSAWLHCKYLRDLDADSHQHLTSASPRLIPISGRL
jgi:hypothetical protein